MHLRSSVRSRRSRCAIAGLAVLALLSLVGPTEADMLTYVDQQQVWLATPDGATKRQLTTDGTAERPWSSPTSDDQGRVLAANYRRTRFMDQTGAVVPGGDQLTPMAAGGLSVGPLQPVVNARGDWAAYSYSNLSFASVLTFYVGLVNPTTTTLSGNQISWSSWYWPTWYGDRLVVSDTQKLFVQPATSTPPAPAAPDFGLAFIQRDGVSYTRGSVARAGNRILLEGYLTGQDGTDFLNIARLPGGVPAQGNGPAGVFDQECRIPTAAKPGSASFSPDGSKIAWADAEGVKVAPTPVFNGAGDCSAGGPTTVISATGGGVSFGAGRLTGAAGAPSDGCPASQRPCTPGAAAGTFSVTIPARQRVKRALRSGFSVPFRCPKTCRLTARLALSKAGARKNGLGSTTLIATGSGRRSGPGAGRIALRFTPLARRRLAGRRLTATLTVSATVGGVREPVRRGTVSLT